MNKSIVICPFCDREQKVEEKHIVNCDRCGKPFNVGAFTDSHPEEFWSNPDSSARF